MSLFVVTEKATGKEIYRYEAAAPIAWEGMELDTHQHDPAPEIGTDGVIVGESTRVFTQREFLRRFTPAEYAAIKGAAQVSQDVDYYWQMFMVAEEIVSNDPDTIAGLNLLEQIQLIGVGRAQEILNG